MRVKLTFPKGLPSDLVGIQCKKCSKIIAIAKLSNPAEALKEHVDACLEYTAKEAKAEKARIDREYGEHYLA